MSKLGKKPIQIPKDTKIKVESGKLILTGPKGSKILTLNDKIFTATLDDKSLILKLIDKTELQAKKIQTKSETKNNPIDNILEKADELAKIFKNKSEVKEIIKNAKNTLVSQTQAFDLKEFTEKRKTQDQQIENFTNILLRFRNKNDPDYQEKLPTLDDINDLEKVGYLRNSIILISKNILKNIL